jgi:hypothetical protein
MSWWLPKIGILVVTLLMAGAIWLYLVRGAAMLLDLQSVSRMLCL